jgi:DNA-binding GntR family transcriptional regulator
MAMKNLSAIVYTRLSERILRWDYLPGHRFTEEGLCEEFKVSRSPVREALHMLAEGGLIEKKPNSGYSVRHVDFREMEELYELRLAIEEFAVSRISTKAVDESRLEELKAWWHDLRSRLPETAGLVPAADEQFHEALAALTGNASLVRALEDIDSRIHFVRLADFSNEKRVATTCDEHLELLEAILAQDPARALDALRRNIEGGRASVEHAIKEALVHAYRRHE